jgi:DMSO/TMAO reductase YedYZ molybdopterin-dependent catalytic subunit
MLERKSHHPHATPNTPNAAEADLSGGQSNLIVRQDVPENQEFRFSSLDSFLTPTDRFYIRNHFPVPDLDVSTWRLRVEGAVERPLELEYNALRRMPSHTQTVTMECAGNSRTFLQPRVRGVQWELGAVGTAEWTGVPLMAVLEQAGLKPSAVDVVLEGADRGLVSDEPKPVGEVSYVRSVPRATALRPDVLLAYQMNGEDLSPAHGFPVRVIVPGWFGMASVKWLTRIVVTEQPFQGFWQTTDYAYWVHHEGFPVRVPLSEMQVKSAIARPVGGEGVPPGEQYRVHGAAWGSSVEIAGVEVSTDGGEAWEAAALLDCPQPNAWVRWEYLWQIPEEPGRYTLLARATDAQGRTQPLHRDANRANYMISHVLPIEVEVGAQE